MSKEEAIQLLFERTPADYIIETYKGIDFYQFTVSSGGDIEIYRIYNNGSIFSK